MLGDQILHALEQLRDAADRDEQKGILSREQAAAYRLGLNHAIAAVVRLTD